nr:EbsA family protein [Thermococcus stetteri]
MLPAFISVAIGIVASYLAGEDTTPLLIVLLLFMAIVLDLMQLKIEVDEEKLKIRSALGFLARKTIRLDEIKLVRISEGWMSCTGMIHYTYPGKACVLVERLKGWSVSFTTNKPEELAEVLRTLGVPVVGGSL